MSKYIIEIAEEYEEYFKGVLICGIADGKFAVDVIAREDLEELNSDYINENFGELQEEAYQRGFEDGRWKAEDGCDGCKYYEDTSLTNPCSECSRGCIDHYKPASDSDRIEVGDEVQAPRGKTIITAVKDDFVHYFYSDGDIGCIEPHHVTKTGKHYDIASILEGMKS